MGRESRMPRGERGTKENGNADPLRALCPRDAARSPARWGFRPIWQKPWQPLFDRRTSPSPASGRSSRITFSTEPAISVLTRSYTFIAPLAMQPVPAQMITRQSWAICAHPVRVESNKSVRHRLPPPRSAWMQPRRSFLRHDLIYQRHSTLRNDARIPPLPQSRRFVMVPLPRISRRAENFERHLSGRSEPAKGVTEWRLGERKKRCRLHKGTRWLLRRPNPECVGSALPRMFLPPGFHLHAPRPSLGAVYVIGASDLTLEAIAPFRIGHEASNGRAAHEVVA
jgi:hypothetical protein